MPVKSSLYLQFCCYLYCLPEYTVLGWISDRSSGPEDSSTQLQKWSCRLAYSRNTQQHLELVVYFELVEMLEVTVFELAPLCFATHLPRLRDIVAFPSFLPSSALSASIISAILICSMFKSPELKKMILKVYA